MDRTPVLVAALAVTLAAPAAFAQEAPGAPAPFRAMAEGHRFGLETDLWPASDYTVAAMGIAAQVQIVPGFLIDLDVPWAVGSFKGSPTSSLFSTTSDPVAGFGNVTIGGHGLFKVGPEAALHAGLSASIPTRLDFSNAGLTYAFLLAAATLTRGFYDVGRFAPGWLSFQLPLGGEVRFARYVYYRGELVPVVLRPSAQGDNHSPQVFLEHADEFEGRLPIGFGVGLRFQAVFTFTDFTFDPGRYRAQTALAPFVQYEPPGVGVFGRLGSTIALNNPLGPPTGVKDGLATFMFTVGGRL